MKILQMQNKALYGSILLAAGFLIFAALGPGFTNHSTAHFNSWQYQIFDVLCHQDPDRSFTISGIKMAVCSRCLGIYGMFLAGWLSLPLYSSFKITSAITEKKWLIAAILLNLADLIGNYFGIWTNTLNSRFMMGGFFGLPLALILANEFFIKKSTE